MKNVIINHMATWGLMRKLQALRNVFRSPTSKGSVRDTGNRDVRESASKFSFDSNLPEDIRLDINEKYNHHSDLLDLFIANRGESLHKWHHYIPLYDRYFSPYRSKKVRLLEIGVNKGGSLKLWRDYFGEHATIFGIDINPQCAKFNGLAGEVRIGSQTDTVFLESVVAEMGGLDLVLDDGSHHMDDIPKTLQILFPHLSFGGIYMVEDLHTAYWQRFGGGLESERNFYRYLFDLVADIHHWYHGEEVKNDDISKECSGIHIHDSMVVLEKSRVYPPVNSVIG